MLPFLAALPLMAGGLYGLEKMEDSLDADRREQYQKDFMKIMNGLDRQSPTFNEDLALGLLGDPRMAPMGNSIFNNAMDNAQRMHEFNNISAVQQANLEQDDEHFNKSEGRLWEQFNQQFDLQQRKFEMDQTLAAYQIDSAQKARQFAIDHGGLDANQYQSALQREGDNITKAFQPLSQAQTGLQQSMDLIKNAKSNTDLYAAIVKAGVTLQPGSSVVQGEYAQMFNTGMSTLDGWAQKVREFRSNTPNEEMRQSILDTLHQLDKTIYGQANDMWSRTEKMYSNNPVNFDLNQLRGATFYNFDRKPEPINLKELKAQEPNFYKVLPKGFRVNQ